MIGKLSEIMIAIINGTVSGGISMFLRGESPRSHALRQLENHCKHFYMTLQSNDAFDFIVILQTKDATIS
jgi:hypothetical protein